MLSHEIGRFLDGDNELHAIRYDGNTLYCHPDEGYCRDVVTEMKKRSIFFPDLNLLEVKRIEDLDEIERIRRILLVAR